MFEINEYGVLIKYNGAEKEVRIPDGVIAIGDDAFARNNKIRSVFFSPSVKSIGRDAFKYCLFLTNVELNEGLVNIDERAFYYCSSLKTVKFPSSLKEIGEYAFYNCAFEEVNIPCVTRICSYAFEECNSLRNIRLGEGCEEIDSCAFPTIEFHGVDIYLPESIKKIEKHAFGGKDSFFDRNFRNYFSPQNKIILDYARNDYGISTWTYTPNESQIKAFIPQVTEQIKMAYNARRAELVNDLIPTWTNFMEDYNRRLSDLDTQINEQSDIIRNAKGILAGRKIEKAKKLKEELASKRYNLQSYAWEDEHILEQHKSELKKIDSMDSNAYEKEAYENVIAALTKKQQELGNCVSYHYSSGGPSLFIDDVINIYNSVGSSSASSSTLPKDDAWGRPAGTSGPHTSGEGI